MARQNFIGLVVSQGKMDKTIKVRVMQKVYDKRFQKEFLKKKNFLVHDESNICREGDLIRIEATRPLSARKFFAVAEIKKNKGQQFAKYQAEAKTRVKSDEAAERSIFLKKRAANDLLVQRSLHSDLDAVQSLRKKDNLTSEEIERIEKLKEKYGIATWDEDMKNKELFQSDITYLASKLCSIEDDLSLNKLLHDILAHPEKQSYKDICSAMKITDQTAKNIRKNLIRKYLKQADNEVLEKLRAEF